MPFIPLLLAAAAAQSDLDSKVDQALSKMTQAEKLRFIGGYRGFDVQPIASLDMASVRMSDGPVGVRNFGPTTAYPAGVALAAAFDPKLARDMGDAIGKDARGRGVGFWLGPGVNLSRVVQNGRNFEYFGEDPYLSGVCAVNVIQGVQAHDVSATVKHYAANNHENDRMVDSSEVDERTMRELYLKPFEMAVKEGHVWSVMCSYNKVNGIYASANKWLLTDVLKNEWGFKGVVMSDWGAAHDAVADFNAGLDLEMGNAEFMTPENIAAALAAGTVKEELLDEKVRRILRVCIANNMFGPQRKPLEPKNDPANAEVAKQEALEGTVLLKNNGILPLLPGSVKDVLVLGPNALKPVTGGGGSAYTTPLHAKTLLESLQAVYPGAHTVPGLTDVIGKPFDFSGYTDLKVAYYKNRNLEGTPVQAGPDTKINHIWTDSHPSPAGMNEFSVRWTGQLKVEKTSEYLAVSRSDDGLRVFIDGKAVIDHWDEHGSATDIAHVKLTAGSHDIKVEYFQAAGEAIAQFGLVELSKLQNNPELNAALEKADAVVIGVGFNSGTEGEGQDRSFELPYDQQLLLDTAVAHSKKIILVLNSGAGVNLSPWLGKVSALFEAWYPGQEGADAIAQLISGDVNPSGKLPTTFPVALKGTYYADAYPPVDHTLKYTEGLLTGYRWFDTKHQKPLFPFGFGLSYTSFKVSDVSAVDDNGTIRVKTKVTNTGKTYGGTDTVQIYIGPANPGPGEPVKRLKAFSRLDLAAGKTGEIDALIPVEEIATWDTPNHQWVVTPGEYVVYVGDSSQNVTAVKIKVTEAKHFAP